MLKNSLNSKKNDIKREKDINIKKKCKKAIFFIKKSIPKS